MGFVHLVTLSTLRIRCEAPPPTVLPCARASAARAYSLDEARGGSSAALALSGRSADEQDRNDPRQIREFVGRASRATTQEERANEPPVRPRMGTGIFAKRPCGGVLVQNRDFSCELAAANSCLSVRVHLEVPEPLCAPAPCGRHKQATPRRVVPDDLEHNPAEQTRLAAPNGELHKALPEHPPEVRTVKNTGESQQPPQRGPSRIELGDGCLHWTESSAPHASAA
jgi:hypothetical protein